MDGRKFTDIIRSFCEMKEFSVEDSTNFELYIIETFQIVKGLMESREYDFIAVRKLGTFFLKVWTVHSRMKELEKKLFTPYEESRKSNVQYRDEKKKYDELQIIYKRMTEDFFDRKIYFAERKRERKEKGEDRRMNMQYMTDMAMDEIEEEQPTENQQIHTENETTGYTETSLGEQE